MNSHAGTAWLLNSNAFTLCDPVTLTFDLIFISGQGIVMDCAKFGDFSFSRLGFIVQTDRQTDRQTERHKDTQRRMIAILTRLVSGDYRKLVLRRYKLTNHKLHNHYAVTRQAVT